MSIATSIRCLSLSASIVAVALAATSSFAGETADAALQGEWRVVAFSYLGAANSRDQIDAADVRVSFRGDKLTMSAQGREITNTAIETDSFSFPRAIDSLGHVGLRSEQGIYKIEGNKLTLIWNDGKGPRPTRFEPTAENTYIEMVRVSNGVALR